MLLFDSSSVTGKCHGMLHLFKSITVPANCCLKAFFVIPRANHSSRTQNFGEHDCAFSLTYLNDASDEMASNVTIRTAKLGAVRSSLLWTAMPLLE